MKVSPGGSLGARVRGQTGERVQALVPSRPCALTPLCPPVLKCLCHNFLNGPIFNLLGQLESSQSALFSHGAQGCKGHEGVRGMRVQEITIQLNRGDWDDFNPYPANQNFRLLRLPPNSTKVLFHTFIHTLPTVTKLYATISSCTACQMYQKLHKIYYIFFHSFLRNFQSKIVNLSVNKI